MKFTHLILSSFVTATAWAKLEDTYAFFIKHEGILNPVHLDLDSGISSRLVWNESTVDVTEFNYEDGYAFFNNPSRTGRMAFDINDGVFLADKTSSKSTKLVLETKTGRLLDFVSYSCGDSNRQVIESKKSNHQCFPVDLYFMKYDRATKKPLEDLYESIDVERYPRGLYVRDEYGMVPLSIDKAYEGAWFAPLHYGKSGDTPIEIITQKNFFIAKVSPSYSAYVTFLGRKLGLVQHPEGFLEFDQNGKLEPWRHFSCKHTDSEDREILTIASGCSDWRDVDIFLLPYDRKTGKPEMGDLEPKLTFKSIPHSFFIKQDETWVALSYKEDTSYSESIFGIPEDPKSEAKPVEFSLRDGMAFTENTSFPGFASINGRRLVVNTFGGQHSFNLDDQKKITNHIFYREKNNKISTDYTDYPDSPQISLYLLPLNRTSGKPLDHSVKSVGDGKRTRMP